MIQGFNLEGQRTIGMIRLELAIGNLSTTSISHVIDSRTSYKLFLGRPWLYEHGVVASTLHQCLNHYRDGEKKVNGDTKPFAKAESYFADARFFDDDAPLKEAMPATISSTGKRSEKDTLRMIHGGLSGNVKLPGPSEKETSEPISPLFKQAMVATSTVALVFRYIPKSHHKDGEAPFSECTTLKSVTKPIIKLKETDWHTLKGKGVLPSHKAGQSKVVGAPVAGFVMSSKGSLEEEVDLPKVRTEDGFDPNSYKLMKKSGYDFNKPVPLGCVIDINETQKRIQEQGDAVAVPKVGIGYAPPQPVQILGRRKDKQSLVQYIVVEETTKSDEEDVKNKPMSSIFSRL